ncbi:MAG: hypothetical protein U0228_11515 [Myxococcaceae bacterium]
MLALALAVVLSGTPPEKTEAFREQMGEALRRHDGGDFAGAISIYRSMLATWPHHPAVVYELSLSMAANRTPPDELIAFVEGELKAMKKPEPILYATLASALDARGDLAKGEAALRTGLKLDPRSGDLHFNLGINLAMQKRSKDALPEFAKATELMPAWPSAWRATSIAFEQNGQRVEALLARSRFVLLEPDGERSLDAALTLEPLLTAGIDDDGKKMTLNVGNTEDLALMLVVTAALTEDKDKKQTPGARFVSAMRHTIEFLAEKPTGFRAHALQAFLDAKKQNCLDAALWELRRALHDPDADTWFAAHADEEARFTKFAKALRKPVP